MFVSNTFYLLSVAALIQVASSQTVLQSYQTFNSIGCFSDNPIARALHHSVGSSTTMTAELCLSQCLIDDGVNDGPGGYALAGLEFGAECYCGNAILNNQAPIAPSLCNMPCSGNSSEICGGSNAINIYQNGDTPYTSGPGAILQASYPIWEFYGCYEDSITHRQIPNKQAIPIEEMSVETCTQTCQTQNFYVAGLQFSQECYCGDVGLPPGIAAPDSSCNMQCTDNANEFCGAANLNLVYHIPLLPAGCELECPSNIVIDGEVIPWAGSDYESIGYLQCEYTLNFNIAVYVCVYSQATGVFLTEYGGAVCEPYLTTCI